VHEGGASEEEDRRVQKKGDDSVVKLRPVVPFIQAVTHGDIQPA
jgi:hypothetical protein